MELEKTTIDEGSPFTWSQCESLAEMCKPERIQAIKRDFLTRQARAKKSQRTY